MNRDIDWVGVITTIVHVLGGAALMVFGDSTDAHTAGVAMIYGGVAQQMRPATKPVGSP